MPSGDVWRLQLDITVKTLWLGQSFVKYNLWLSLSIWILFVDFFEQHNQIVWKWVDGSEENLQFPRFFCSYTCDWLLKLSELDQLEKNKNSMEQH